MEKTHIHRVLSDSHKCTQSSQPPCEVAVIIIFPTLQVRKQLRGPVTPLGHPAEGDKVRKILLLSGLLLMWSVPDQPPHRAQTLPQGPSLTAAGLLGSGVQNLPTIVSWREIFPDHPALIPDVEIPTEERKKMRIYFRRFARYWTLY